MVNELEICRQTKTDATQALYLAFKKLLKARGKISESELRDIFLKELRKNKKIFPDGWYTPPPFGIAVLFGPAKRGGRTSYKMLRPEKMWPKDNIYFGGRNNFVYVYCSPVDRKTKIIGDIGLSIYTGKNPKIIRHLRKCLEINRKIFDFIEIGKTVAEVNKYAFKIIKEEGLTNDVETLSDPSGSNIGHSIPIPNKIWSKKQTDLLNSDNTPWEIKKDIISKKRFFFNGIEKTKFKKSMAITIEPRIASIKDKDIPLTSFHTIVLIHDDGRKELLVGYEKIFKLFGMDYLL